MAERTTAIRRTAATLTSTLRGGLVSTALTTTLIVGTGLASIGAPVAQAVPPYSGGEGEPSGGEMMVDAAIARPIGLATTLVGAVAFVVTLPFSALGGNIDQAAEKLVIEPGRETFVRCLGCRQAGRADRFRGDEDEVQ